MKTYIVSIFFLWSYILSAQTDKSVASIRKTIIEINKDTTYALKTLENEQFLNNMTDGGGKLTGYFKDGRLIKVVEQIGLYSCKMTSEYYLKDNLLIFAYLLGEDYIYIDSISKFNYSDLKKVYEGRYYFKNGKLIDKKTNGESRCSGQPPTEWTKREEEEFNRYVFLLTK